MADTIAQFEHVISICRDLFVKKLKDGDDSVCSTCEHTNFCIGRMYNLSMQCYTTCEDITPALRKEAEKSAASQR